MTTSTNILTAVRANNLFALQQSISANRWLLRQDFIRKEDVNGFFPLLVAVQNNQAEMVRTLLDGGADVHQKFYTGETSLYSAAFRGHKQVVQILLAHGAKNVPTDKGFTPSFIAAQNGHADVLQLLIEAGNDPDETNYNAVTPLQIAAKLGQVKVIKLLLTYKVNVDHKDRAGHTALLSAVANEKKEAVEILLKAKANPNEADVNGCAPLYAATEKNNLAIMKLLIAAGAKVDQQTKSGATALYKAAEKGHLDAVDLLIKANASVDLSLDNGTTPIYIAAANGHAKVVDRLLQAGASTDTFSFAALPPERQTIILKAKQKKYEQLSPHPNDPKLYQAVSNNNLEEIEALLQESTSVDATNGFGFTSLYLAAERGFTSAIAALLNAGANVNLTTGGGDTPLHAAALKGHDVCIRLLLQGGAEVDQPNHKGIVPLMLGSMKGHYQAVKVLLNAGAKIYKKALGNTSLNLAAMNGQETATLALLQAGAKVDEPNEDSYSSLHLAAKGGHATVIDLLLKAEAKVDQTTKASETALYIAALTGHHLAIGVLLRWGAQTNIFNNVGFTPLFIAAFKGHLKAVEALIAGGAAVDQPNKNGTTALDGAAEGGHAQVIRLLVKHGAKVDDPNPFNRMKPIRMAVQKGHVDAVLALIECGADLHDLDTQGASLLFLACFLHDDPSLVQILLSAGIDINKGNLKGITPVYIAAQNNNCKALKALLDAGANVNLAGETGMVPLYIAVQKRQVEAVKLLMAAGANPSLKAQWGQSPLDYARINGLSNILTLLTNRYPKWTVQKPTIASKPASSPQERPSLDPLPSSSPLLLLGHGGPMQSCLKAHASERILTLHQAAAWGFVDVMKSFLNRGENINFGEGAYQVTPLHFAASGGHLQATKLLLSYGADPRIKCSGVWEYGGKTALDIAKENGHLEIVQLLERTDKNREPFEIVASKNAVENFLLQIVQSILVPHQINLPPLFISYVQDDSSGYDLSAVLEQLKSSLTKVGFPVTPSPLTDVEGLEKALNNHSFAFILCSPAYAKKVESFPKIRQLIDAFGRKRKNALHPLLCAGGFNDTALKIVDRRYMIRNCKEMAKIQSEDSLLKLQNFVDVFLNLAGQQGLGILPDILGLKQNKNSLLHEKYANLFNRLEVLLRGFAIDYRLKEQLESSWDYHFLKSHFHQVQLPSVQGYNRTGFSPLLQDFLDSPAKVCLLLSPQELDLQWMHLALIDQLLKNSSLPVLQIDCEDYPGMSAHHCIERALQNEKIDPQDVYSKSILIWMKGYQNFKTYDNLYMSNQLSAWSDVKLLVTCKSDFFQKRGYLRCFLSQANSRQTDDIIVHHIPRFTTATAQKISLPIALPPPLVEPPRLVAMHPKKAAELLELNLFLNNLKKIWVEHDYLDFSPQKNPQIFISYAWEAEEEALAIQQSNLYQMSHDLTTLGFPTWLDIEQMTGNIDEQITGNISESQIVFIIGTERYHERAKQATNVQKEFQEILKKMGQDPTFKVFLLHFSDIPELFPEELRNQVYHCNFRKIDKGIEYIESMTHPQEGLLAKLLADIPEKQSLYVKSVEALNQELQLVVGKHLIVDKGQELCRLREVESRLHSYILPYGLSQSNTPLTQRFDLGLYVEKFLNHPTSKTSVVLGSAGSGKSLFALSLFQKLLKPWKNNKNLTKWLPIYISLKNGIKDPANFIEQTLMDQFQLEREDIEALKAGLGHKQSILFILDGYDELGPNVFPNFSQALADWKTAKLLVTSRTEHFKDQITPQQALSLYMNGQPVGDSVICCYISPFNSDDIEHYLQKQDKKQRNLHQTLLALPNIQELLATPFLLAMIVQSLQSLLANSQQNRRVTRADVYKAFIETWFLQETKGRELNPTELDHFCQELAFQLFREKTLNFTASSFDPKKESLLDAAPVIQSGGEHRFVHKSVYEYFVALRFWRALKEERDILNVWSLRYLTEEPSIIDFLAEFYFSESFNPNSNEQVLNKLVEKSKEPIFPSTISSNAFSVLCASSVPFSGRQLSGIRIPNASCAHSIFDHADLSHADLTGTTWTGSWLKSANLTGVNLKNSVWQEKSGLIKKDKINNHTSPIFQLRFNPSGEFVVSAAKDSKIKLWNLHVRDVHKTIHLDSQINHFALSQDQKWLAIASENKKTQIWSTDQGTLHKTFGNASEVECVVFTPDQKEVICGNRTGEIFCYTVESGLVRYTIEGIKESIVTKAAMQAITGLAFHPIKQVLVSCSKGNRLNVRKIKGEATSLKKEYQGYSPIQNLTFSQQGEWFLFSEGNIIKIWDGNTFYPKVKLKEAASSIEQIALSPDNQFLMAFEAESKSLHLWHFQRQNLSSHQHFSIPLDKVIHSIALYQKGDEIFLATGFKDCSWCYWKLLHTDQTPSLQLLFSSVTMPLNLENACLKEIQGITENELQTLARVRP